MFGIVSQDYKVGEDILQQCGLDLIKVDHIAVQRFEPQRIQSQHIQLQTTGMVFLRRGVVGMSVVGYV